MNKPDKRIALYTHLFSLYPKAYREQFGDQILQTTLDMLDGVTDRKERQRLWVRLALDMQMNIGRQHLKNAGEYMKNINQRLLASALWGIIAALAWLAFPHVRAIGTTWMNTAGGLRVIGLLLFVLAFIAIPSVMAVLALFDRPKTIYQKLLN